MNHQRLDKIVATNNPLNKVVFDLVDWAEANDVIVPLLAAAAKGRPSDATLVQLAAEISAAQSQSAAQGTLQRIDLDQQLRRGAGDQPNIDPDGVVVILGGTSSNPARLIAYGDNTSGDGKVIVLTSTNGSVTCERARSGLILQTPSGQAGSMVINGVTIQLR